MGTVVAAVAVEAAAAEDTAGGAAATAPHPKTLDDPTNADPDPRTSEQQQGYLDWPEHIFYFSMIQINDNPFFIIPPLRKIPPAQQPFAVTSVAQAQVAVSAQTPLLQSLPLAQAQEEETLGPHRNKGEEQGVRGEGVILASCYLIRPNWQVEISKHFTSFLNRLL